MEGAAAGALLHAGLHRVHFERRAAEGLAQGGGVAPHVRAANPHFLPLSLPLSTHHAPRTTHHDHAPRTTHHSPLTPHYRYVLAAYSLNGTYLGLRELSDELQLCSGKAEDPTAYLKFGVGLKVECSLMRTLCPA